MSDATQILSRIASGDAAAADELVPLVYAELRQLASKRLAGDPAIFRRLYDERGRQDSRHSPHNSSNSWARRPT